MKKKHCKLLMHDNSLNLSTNLIMFQSQNQNRFFSFNLVYKRINSTLFWHYFLGITSEIYCYRICHCNSGVKFILIYILPKIKFCLTTYNHRYKSYRYPLNYLPYIRNIWFKLPYVESTSLFYVCVRYYMSSSHCLLIY